MIFYNKNYQRGELWNRQRGFSRLNIIILDELGD